MWWVYLLASKLTSSGSTSTFGSRYPRSTQLTNRRIPIDATPLITQLLQICSRESCPEMKADEWQYLCVAHGGEGTDRCCAIDYILHACVYFDLPFR